MELTAIGKLLTTTKSSVACSCQTTSIQTA